MTSFKLKNKFVVVIPVYNAPEFITEAILSVCSQDFSDVGIIIRDDLSNDDTPQIIHDLIGIDGRKNTYTSFKGRDVLYIRNASKMYGGGNTYDSGMRLIESGETIVGVVDGDDYLTDSAALKKIHKIYEQYGMWQVWSQHRLQSNYLEITNLGFSNSLPSDDTIYTTRDYWSVSHFRTCKNWLFSKINPKDLTDPFFDEPFCRVAGDAAFIYPITELCGNHKSYFLNEPLYYYRNMHANNDHNLSQDTVKKYSDFIRQKKHYSPLNLPL